MSKVIVQVPMDKKLRDKATEVVKQQGVSSLQEAFRIFAAKLSTRRARVDITDVEYLTPSAEERYAKMDEDFKKGKNWYHAKDVNDLMRQLHEDGD